MTRQTGLDIGQFSSGNGWVVGCSEPQKGKTPGVFFSAPGVRGKKKVSKKKSAEKKTDEQNSKPL